MARIPYTGAPDVSPNPAPPSDYQNIQANPAAFGGVAGQAEQKFGGALEQGAQADVNSAIIKQDRFNQIASDDAFNQFQDAARKLTFGDPGDPNSKGLYSLRGADALSAGPGVVNQLSSMREQIGKGLQNDAQRLQFEQQSRRMLDYKQSEISRHLDAQQDAYGMATNQATIKNAAADASTAYNSDEAVANGIQQARSGAVQHAQIQFGQAAGPEVLKSAIRDADTMVVRDTVNAAMAANQPDRAMSVLNKFGDHIDPIVRESLTRMAKTKADDVSDDAFVRGLIGGAPATAPGSGPKAVGATWDRMLKQESGGKQFDAQGNPLTSSAGAIGIAQVEPATAKAVADRHGIDYDPAALKQDGGYNHMLGRAYFGDLVKNYDGNVTLAAAAYDAGPGHVDQWIKEFGDPRKGGVSDAAFASQIPLAETRNYVMNTAVPSPVNATAARPTRDVGAQGPSYPDESALVQKAVQATEGDPERQHRVLSKLTQQLSVVRLATQTDRSDLEKSIPDIQAAALGGQDVVIPEARIRGLLPPAEAAEKIENLQVAQQAGLIFKGVQFGSQDDIQAAYRDLSSGMGPISTMVRHKGTPQLGTAGAAAPGSDQETPEAYRLRTSILKQFEAQVQTRNAALTQDPAGYASSEPTVAAAAARLHQSPDDPGAMKAYINATTTVQQHLGVPEDQTHILTTGQAQELSHKLTTVDPATGDMGAQLSQVAKQYGDAWPKAFGDLVTLGKLPAAYQMLSSIQDPAERTNFQRALSTVATKGGIEKLKTDAPADAIKTIDQGLDEKIDEFRKTAAVPGLTNNDGLIANVKNAIKTYAYHDALTSGDGQKALDNAYNAILGNKYDFDGTMRVPKGMLSQVQTVTSNLQSNLKPTDVAPLAADTMATAEGPGLTVAQRQDVTVRAAQRGQWIPNERDDGLVLVGKLRNGAMVQLKKPDGSRIEVPFKGIQTQATAVQQSPGVDDLGRPLPEPGLGHL